MILRILLGVACLSLLNASQAEAQLFRRFRSQPQTQPQPQSYAPQAGVAQNGAAQNGYQGKLTASQRSRPSYIRRADGSVVRYYPNNAQQTAAQKNAQAKAKTKALQEQKQAVAAAKTQIQPTKTKQPNFVTTQGQLTAVRPTTAPTRRLSSVYRQPTPQPSAMPVAPVGISVLNQPKTTIGSISPATQMPQAVATRPDPASAIPVNTAATNPAPSGLSLSSLSDNVVPASADMAVKPAAAILDSNGQKTFSVLETIE